jgi:peptidoglycan-associated lipoprotein
MVPANSIVRSNSLMRFSRLAMVVMVAGLLGACASKTGTDDGGALGAGGANVPGSIQDFVVNVGDRVFFDSDSSEINASGQSTLDKQAQWLARYPQYSFTLEGHADERGTREYNFALGARRSEAAKNYLVARGVGANRVRTTSYGKERPVAVCNDISCWSQNRRAVTVLGGAGS